MRAKLLSWMDHLETLSLRERVMALVGVPLALLAAGEWLVFDPARNHAAEARKQAERLSADVKALSAALAAQPAVTPLPAADQLLRQSSELQAQIAAGDEILAAVHRSVDWGTVVRATAAGTPGLVVSQLKTLPAEEIFAASMIKPAAEPARRAASAAGAKPSPAPAQSTAPPNIDTIYRHRAELTVTGDFPALLGYLQTLQHVPGDLRWDRLQLAVVGYPHATAQLTLYTLSTRSETPFN